MYIHSNKGKLKNTPKIVHQDIKDFAAVKGQRGDIWP